MHGVVRSVASVAVASMRPPLIAGENIPVRVLTQDEQDASMRPPLIAGENTHAELLLRSRHRGFNEAPADRGGKRPYSERSRRGRHCFNEAPADRGGKQHLLEAATQAACGARMREVAICSLTIGPLTPTRGARLADNNLILKEQSTVRAVPRRRAVTGALAALRRVQTMIGSRATGVKDRLPSETTLGSTLSARPRSMITK